jgi:PleD family two-component response regulator
LARRRGYGPQADGLPAFRFAPCWLREADEVINEAMTKVLLVEDNEMNRDMLSRRLARRGLQVVCAVDGRQGVDLSHAAKSPTSSSWI